MFVKPGEKRPNHPKKWNKTKKQRHRKIRAIVFFRQRLESPLKVCE